MNINELHKDDLVIIDLSKLGKDIYGRHQLFDDEIIEMIVKCYPLGVIRIENIKYDSVLKEYVCDFRKEDGRDYFIGLPIRCIVAKVNK